MPTPAAAAGSITAPVLHATSQQTRFHLQPSAKTAVNSSVAGALDIPGVTLTLGRQEILTDAHIKFTAGVRYVLAGQNGVGKSTLMRAIGEKLIPGIYATMKVGYLKQGYVGEESDVLNGDQKGETVVEYVVRSDKARTDAIRKRDLLHTALENPGEPAAVVRTLRAIKHEQRLIELEEAKKAAMLRSGARGMKARKELKALEEQVAAEEALLGVVNEETVAVEIDEAVALLAELENELEAMSASTANSRAESLLLGLGFPENTIHKPLSTLSGGFLMRTRLASLLIQTHDLLLLDEPTNFLDLPSLLWLETYLLNSLPPTTTLLLVTHDRAFGDTLAQEVLILRDQKLEHYPGTLSGYLHTRAQQQRRLTKMKAAQDTQIAHIKATIAGNVRAARVSGDDKKLKQAASRQKKLDDRMGYQVGARGGRFKLNRDLPGYHTSMRAEIDIPKDDPAARIFLPKVPAPELRFPGALVACEGLVFKYRGAKEPVLKGVTLTIHPGDRVALLGLNGAGKSTLIGCLVGDEIHSTPSSGTVTRHAKARIAYFSQAAVEALPSNKTALEFIGGEEQASRGILSTMGLVGKTVSELPIGHLSGGQKVRVALLKELYPSDGVIPHLLVLDEVTTHLDAASVALLASELRKYQGTLLLVSHDRWFVRRVVEGDKESMNVDEEEDGEEEESNDEGEIKNPGRVYLVRAGGVHLLKGGVTEFEEKVRNKKRKKKVN